MSYIIDFERLNELTTVVTDNQCTMPITYGNTLSRSILKEYMDIYVHKRNSLSITTSEMEGIIKTLVYNRILIGPAEIRDRKIDTILS